VADGPYSIGFVSSAKRELAKLPRGPKQRVAAAIDDLAREPRPRRARLMAGERQIWRIRVGDYRVLYLIHDDRLMVLVVRVGHRREVYR
jgi:mRNA interferase RelE/StbE